MGRLPGSWKLLSLLALALSTSPFVADAGTVGDWQVFLGGWGIDQTNAMTVDRIGGAVVVGWSTRRWCRSDSAADACVVPDGVRQPFAGPEGARDAFVAKVGPGGALAWYTFLGGGGTEDAAYGVASDAAGNTYVVGFASQDWDLLRKDGSGCGANPAGKDWFVVKLSPGGDCEWRAYVDAALGLEGAYQPTVSIAVDDVGNAYLAAMMDNRPCVIRLDAGGMAQTFASTRCTRFVGSEKGFANHVAVGADGTVYVTGVTVERLTNPPSAQSRPFVARIPASETAPTDVPVPPHFIGASGEVVNAIAVDGAGVAYVAGDDGTLAFVRAFSWPPPDTPESLAAATWRPRSTLEASDGFVAAGDQDHARAIALHEHGGAVDVYVVGDTHDCSDRPVDQCSTWEPGLVAPIVGRLGHVDAWLAKLDFAKPAAARLEGRLFLGGAANEWAFGVGVDDTGNVYAAGYGAGAWSDAAFDDPVAAYRYHAADSDDPFVARFPPSTFCPSTDACDGASCLARRARAWGRFQKCVYAAVASYYGDLAYPYDADLQGCRAAYFKAWKPCWGPRFVVADTTVTDRLSGLVWERKTATVDHDDYSVPHNAANRYVWRTPNAPEIENGTAFISFLRALNDGTDVLQSHGWRIPTLVELLSIMTVEVQQSAVFPEFADTASGGYWSVTGAPIVKDVCSPPTRCAWNVAFIPDTKPFLGTVTVDGTDVGRHLRAVRGGL